jgi:predicted outer membrane repeat protein
VRRSLAATPLLIIVIPLAASASTLLVDWSGGGDYPTIAEAVAAAAAGDTILVAAGTYTGPSNRDIDVSQNNLSLVSEAGPEATVIDCESAGRALVIGGARTVVSGFTFANGSAEEGGALRLGPVSTTLLDCRFVDNEAERGGALYCTVGSALEADICAFDYNSASNYGGAVYTTNARITMYECTFDGNSGGINGGAVSMKQGTVGWFMDCTFNGNSAQSGGALYIGTFATWWWGEEGLGTTIGFSSFSGNEAERGGALYVNARCEVEVIWCTLVANEAEWGGALYGVTHDPGRVFVQHCTLYGNAAHYGGGVCTCGAFWDPDWSEFRVSRSIIAFSTEGSAICRLDDSYAFADCSIAYGNEGGDVLYGGDLNLYGDPLFCNVYQGDFALCENSQARPENNPWGVLMGSCSQQCGPCESPVQWTSWGRIKARYR